MSSSNESLSHQQSHTTFSFMHQSIVVIGQARRDFHVTKAWVGQTIAGTHWFLGTLVPWFKHLFQFFA